MPQDDKAKEPSVTFQAKAGLPSDPQPMEVNAAEGDLKPWEAFCFLSSSNHHYAQQAITHRLRT